MYEFYQTPPTVGRREVVLPKFVYVRNGLAENLMKKITYQRENPQAVRSNHFIVRLLESISVDKTIEDLRYVDSVSDITMDLAMSLNMTSAMYQGEAFEDGPFYGRESTEILIAHATGFDLGKGAKRWWKLEPIRFLRHPKTDLNMDVPNGEPTGSETGISVIEINIPMLAFQYKKWMENEYRVRRENPRSTMQFVRMYVLPNMLYTQLDIALFNRQVARLRGKQVMESGVRDPYYLTDWSAKVDELIEGLFGSLVGRLLSFDAILHNLLVVNHDSIFDIMALPKGPKTRQVIWALAIARIPYFSYLLEMDFMTGSSMNRSEMNQLRRAMRRLRVDRDIEKALPTDIAEEVKLSLRTDIEAYL